MREKRIFLIAIILVLSLCACSSSTSKADTYTVSKEGVSYTVDRNNSVISDESHEYHYTISGTSERYDIDIIYPDDSTYWWHGDSNGAMSSSYGGGSDDYDENRYVPGGTLCDILEENELRHVSSVNIIFVIILAVIGVFNVIWPYISWYLGYGWRYRDTEPSDAALVFNRISGIILILIAIVMIFL
ncbi:MAG: hypothetical protein Q4F05_13315 [bacterium]|nr:hypothetical protein [bacterium]